MTAKRRGQAAHFERTSGIRFSKASFSEPSVGNGMETLCLPAHHQFGSTETKHGSRSMIKKVAGGYKVLSEKGKNLGGPYKTKKEAAKRLRQVEFFKHKK